MITLNVDDEKHKLCSVFLARWVFERNLSSLNVEVKGYRLLTGPL